MLKQNEKIKHIQEEVSEFSKATTRQPGTAVPVAVQHWASALGTETIITCCGAGKDHCKSKEEKEEGFPFFFSGE